MGGLIDRLRQPAYTGQNRCIPCTAANVVIAAIGSVAVAAVASPIGPSAAAAAGVVVLLGSLAAIYLRGYLVPGTPTLTKRYFPGWLLAAFDKHETATGIDSSTDEGRSFVPTPETVLLDAGAVDECEHEDDLCLTDGFGEAWKREIEGIRGEGAEASVLAEVLGVAESALSIEEFGDAFDARVDGRRVGQWESRAALIADLAAARVLRPRYDRWADLPVDKQGEVLYGLRVFLDACPRCDSPVALEEGTVESCCREIDVVAMSCEECGSRLVESEVPA